MGSVHQQTFKKEGDFVMNQIFLTDGEIVDIQSLLGNVTDQYHSVNDAQFLTDVTVFAHKLPERLRMFLNNFRLQEPFPGTALISGYPVDQAQIGKTPAHWNERPTISPALKEEVFLMLCGSLLGDIFGF